jgi:hypothetical protein
MSLRSDGATTRDTSHALRILVLEVALAGVGCAAPQLALAQDVPAFAPGMINHMQQMKRFKDVDHGQQPTPPVIPRFSVDPDPTGAVGTFQPNGATFTVNNAFFQNLGTNGRTCFSCHQPQDGWTVSAADVAKRFAASGGTDPIFRLVDGATCPSDDVSNFAAKQRAYKLLIDRGLIRIQSRLLERDHVGWPRAQSDQPGDRCHARPRAGQRATNGRAVGRDRRIRKRHIRRASLRR